MYSFPDLRRGLRWTVFGLVLATGATAVAEDAQLRLRLPKRSKPTPVQKLNQDGVKAVQKHDYERAKRLFYQAYLIDPNDPFTLNNLGYMAEMEGEIERAQRYYALATENTSDATIDVASEREVEGKAVSQIAGNAVDRNMQVNRLNVEAMGLLMKDRAPEADIVLQKALAIDAKNPFTLNNMGLAKEKEGELEQALRYYQEAANTRSDERVVVTVRKDWRGKPISEVAAQNAKAARKILDRSADVDSRVARLNLRGVSALNRNNRRLAREYFNQAYKLDPNNAFTMNNMGYVAELDGDRETATFFYEKAKTGRRSNAPIALASRRDAEGMRLDAIAATNNTAVDQAQQAALEARRREGGAVVLRKRDNTPVHEAGGTPTVIMAPRRADESEVRIPVGEDTAPGAEEEGNIVLPAGNQPTSQPTPPEAQPGTSQPGTQPPAAGQQEPLSSPPLPPQQRGQEPTSTPPAPPEESAPVQGQDDGGLLMPIPEDQQPPAAQQPPQN